MPIAIPEGDTGTTTTQLAAYAAAVNKAAGQQTAAEQEVVAQVEGQVTSAAGGWTDSGGPGGHQAENALRVAAFAGELEARRVAAVNQYAGEAAGGTLRARRAQAEMHGADTQSLVEMYRMLVEMESRLNDSPY
jgi:hypothetical protein